MRRVVGTMAAWLLAWVLCVGAEAQQTQDPPGYQDHIADAVREFDAGNFEEARSLFLRAHNLFPNARTHRGLGFTEFELRNYGESIRHLQLALTSEVKPLDERLRSDTKRVLHRAQNFVGHLRLNAEPEPTQILIDEVPVEIPEGQAILLRVGDHTIELRTAGYAPERRRLSFKGGEEQTLHVAFSRPVGPQRAAPAPAEPLRGAEQPRRDSRRWVKSPWLWTAVGLLVVGAAVGTGVAVARRNDGSTLTGP